MKVVIVTDTHFHDYSLFRKEINGQGSRLKEHFDAMRSVFLFCHDHNIPELWNLGDVFHTRDIINVRVYNGVYDLFKEGASMTKIKLLVGTHDLCLRGGDNSLRLLSEVVEVKYSEAELIDNVLVVWGAWNVSLEVIEALVKSIPPGKYKKKILLAHMGIEGAEVRGGFKPAEEIKLADIKKMGFDLVLLGHYHKRQYLANNILYVGALCHHTFREAGYEDGFIVLDLDSLLLKSYGIDSPKFLTVDKVEDVPAEGRYYLKTKKPYKILPNNILGCLVEEDVAIKEKNKARLTSDMTEEEMIEKYVKKQDTQLDKKKLIEIGKKLIK